MLNVISTSEVTREMMKQRMLMAKMTIAGRVPSTEYGEHTDHAKNKAKYSHGLHRPDQPDPGPQVFNLCDQVCCAGIQLIPRVQTPDKVRDSQETIRVSQHQKRNGRE